MKFEVISLTDADLQWGFDDNGPHYQLKNGEWTRQETVDPTPCYAHDPILVRTLCDRLNQVAPLDGETYIYLTNRECVGRTNGWASPWSYYKDEDKDKFGASITLSGKRIPLHPAMTRYLVTHEYGHVVEFWLKKRYLDGDKFNFREAYGKLRQFNPDVKYYGPGTWHKQIGEIFANDFRCTIAFEELEFWPHPDVFRAREVHDANFVKFWQAMMRMDYTVAAEVLKNAV
jgi:hypothetical protein